MKKHIKIKSKDVFELLKKLEQLQHSLELMQAHYSSAEQQETLERSIGAYCLANNTSQQLMQMKVALVQNVKKTYGDKAAKKIKKAYAAAHYWSATPEHTPSVDIASDQWHQEQVNALTASLVIDFSYIFDVLQRKKQHIYACALVLDSDCVTAYSVVSTQESLKKQHKNKEWDASEWCFGTEEEDVTNGLNDFMTKLIERYWEVVVPQFSQGLDYEPERQKNIKLFIAGMREAKLLLIEKYGDAVEKMVFYLTIPGEPSLEKYSANAINSKKHKKTKELLDHLML